ncbi:penicillin-binding protein 2 [Pontibacillus yanchengensis]|uniref:Penicillin-binding protein 2 n=1 Tax=Pontibacillus yanchengensis TaxID=462910 RepID=A0ACC7VFZ1_9BACI|nr:penicillin-binding protein 2 [Pontibacillus yanchengensis]MYL53891.1 penicillin-binding protein 2 [Pontibacillus yanchengensis]
MGKKKNGKKSQVPFRLNVLFFLIFLLFSGLILQLGVVQILYGADAQEEINKTTNQKVSVPVPRGKMYDRNGNVVADTQPLYSITYTPMDKTPSQQHHLELAKELAKLIDMNEEDTENIPVRDQKDYWILNNEGAKKERLTEEELKYTDEEKAADAPTPYEILLDKIDPEEDLNYGKKELEIIAIKRKMDSAYAFTPHVIKNKNVTQEEYARVAEHQQDLQGINVSTDWKRSYPYEGHFRDFLGSVTEDGLPRDSLDYFLARNYSRNARVGDSGLEKKYEALLKGQKKTIQYETDRNGNIVDENVINKGQQGKNLQLTVDMELQQRMDEILKEHITKARNKFPYANRFLDEAMAVAMNPQTGEILGMSGQTWNDDSGEFRNTGINTVTSPVAPGSAVKGATLLAGYDYGVVSAGETILDQPIDLAGTPLKASYSNLGYVNDIEALKRSSNVYMFHIGMRIAGDPSYQKGEKLSYQPGRFQVFRNYYAQFGLGVKTGIDLPSETETAGLLSDNYRAGNMLDLAIGQYDTYSALQLAQYVSTIANDGYRLQPRLVNDVRKPVTNKENKNQLGPIIQSNDSNVLNRITMEERYIERVQKGFYQVFNNPRGTADGYFADAEGYTAAGKTGTAQVNYYEPLRDENGDTYDYKPHELENLTLVGYAPYEDPEIAFAVLVPNTGSVSTGYTQYQANKEIGRDILDAYFQLKEERGLNGNADEEEENEENEE